MAHERAPHTVPASYPPVRTGRFAASIRTESPRGCAIGLIGLADDRGVAMNGGRPGARFGPAAIRQALAGYGVANDDLPSVYDAGDIEPADTLDKTHDRVTEAVAWMISHDLLPIGLGGGHDLTFPFVRALASQQASQDEGLVGVYCDPHLDVRAEPGSGMPFRSLVEHCGVRELHINGYNSLANSGEHVAWFTSHGGHIDRFGPRDPWPDGKLFFSFDLDVIDQAFAPGVSAANPCGWSPAQAEAWAYAAGRCERVACFDLMELSPPNDRESAHGVGQTARLAAHMLLTFCQGFAERGR